MTHNDNSNDNVIQMNLASWCRWKALYFKYTGILSTSMKDLKEEEGPYIEKLSNYKRKWIIDGLGTPLAKINGSIIKAALGLMIEDFGTEETIRLITSSDNDYKLFLQYCFDLQYNK